MERYRLNYHVYTRDQYSFKTNLWWYGVFKNRNFFFLYIMEGGRYVQFLNNQLPDILDELLPRNERGIG